MTARPRPLTSEELSRDVIPELLRRWDSHCFCHNPQFLKLISFNFEDYGTSPLALVDSEFMIRGILFERLEPVTGWVPSEGGADRTDRCPQCGEIFHSRYDQYSINMDRTTTRLVNPRQKAETGRYVSGFCYFANSKSELQRIHDFEPAASVDEFIESISRS